MAFTFPPKVVFGEACYTFVSILDRFGVPIGYPDLIFSYFSHAFSGHRIFMLFQCPFNSFLVSSKPVESCSCRSGSVILHFSPFSKEYATSSIFDSIWASFWNPGAYFLAPFRHRFWHGFSIAHFSFDLSIFGASWRPFSAQ